MSLITAALTAPPPPPKCEKKHLIENKALPLDLEACMSEKSAASHGWLAAKKGLAHFGVQLTWLLFPALELPYAFLS